MYFDGDRNDQETSSIDHMTRVPVFQSFLAVIFLLTVSCESDQRLPATLMHPGNRLAAEWEPALGALIAWPLDIPHRLVIELAADSRLFTMVPDEEARSEAEHWFGKWGIPPAKVTFILAPQGPDSWWVRDWGPFAVFGPDGEMLLAHGQYQYSTPVSGRECDGDLRHIFAEKDSLGNERINLTNLEDRAPDSIAVALDVDVLDLPFTFTGGNVFTDGRGLAVSSCILKNENRFIGGNDDQLIRLANKWLGIERYHFISNFERRGIQHIDCLLKMLDEERLLVARPPADHPLSEIYEKIVSEELKQLKNSFGRPFKIWRLDTDVYRKDDLAAYTNSLILNQVVYVPLFGIPQDSMALVQWQQAMPGYEIKGFEYRVAEEPVLHPEVREIRHRGLGWDDGDALHCRTRAVWDPQMLYLSVDRIPKIDQQSGKYRWEALILDYSKKGLITHSLQMHWRPEGDPHWHAEPLMTDKDGLTHFALLSEPGPGQRIEFYFTAASHSGKEEAMPRSAPEGFYTFSAKH